MYMWAAAAAKEPTRLDVLEQTGVVAVVVALLGAAATYWFGVVGARRKERQERYSEMTATLASWSEVPFRVRRRTSDNAETLAGLVAHMSELQECLRRDQAYLRAECGWLADRRDAAQAAVQDAARPSINEAWTLPPCETAVSMNLGEWGPTDMEQHLNEFSCELKWRFGWRWMLRPLLH